MMIPEQIAVTAVLLAAAFSLLRRAVTHCRKPRSEKSSCSGCGCGRSPLVRAGG
ncbi:MAG: hypothetical protein WC003_08550 [Terrimicrobiaceae bacterium]